MNLKKYVSCVVAVLVVLSVSGCSLNQNNDRDVLEDKPPQILTADYAELFQSIHGCAVIFDTSKNTYTFYNEEECKTQASPCSTFKVVATLMGLHSKSISSQESKMGYNGTNYPIEAWNADLDLTEAFQNSCVWYFRKVIDKTGPEYVQKELDALKYGNCDISEWRGSDAGFSPETSGFWLGSSLKISPLEQVDILRDIVEGKTHYTEAEIEILKTIMLVETDNSKQIYGKTGTGIDHSAWFIGFVKNGSSYQYFAVYLKDDASDVVNGAKAKEIALDIINESL